MLITFEGLDFSGKTTQAKMLDEYLEANGYSNYTFFREPGGTELSEDIRSLILNSSEDPDPMTEVYLFQAARRELFVREIMPRLERNELVICDRFTDSSVAYQGYGHSVVGPAIIRTLNSLSTDGVIPDLTFYLKIDLPTFRSRNKYSEKDRMESHGEQFFRDVIQGFNDLADHHTERIVTIDGTLDRESIHESIVQNLELFVNARADSANIREHSKPEFRT